MKKLIFATSNPHKLEEIRDILPGYTILGLEDAGIIEEIQETGTTLEENAIIKAQYLFDKSGKPSFAEDTGLEVFALDGAPGVHTARYAGDERDPNKNMDLLLQNLMDKADRTARFRTVIAYISNQGRELFEGIVTGTIAYEKSGIGGFGYDPVFIPDGYDKSFASLTKEVKNKISHRARAVQALIDHLQQHI
jgi:XTP/dITP diphosphohydrolase